MRKTFILTLFMMFCSITFGQNVKVAKIGDTEYGTLAAAIKAATPGQTITLLKDTKENVTSDFKENITIDGAGHTLNGYLQPAYGPLTIKNLTFDGTGIGNKYFIEITSSTDVGTLTVEDCTAKNGQGLAQLMTSINTTVRNVTVENSVTHGVKINYGTLLLENVHFDAMAALACHRGGADKKVTIKNSYLYSVSSMGSGSTKRTYIFEGDNTVDRWDVHPEGYAQPVYYIDENVDYFKLADLNSTLTTRGGLYVYTNLPKDQHQCVIYEEGKYHHHDQIKVGENEYYDIVAKVAQNDETHNGNEGEGIFYKYLYEAIDASKEVGKIYVVANTVARPVDNVSDKSTRGIGSVINHDLTIEFNNFRHAFTQPVGSTGTESNGFQILKGNNVTLQNGRMYVDAGSAKKFYILIQNYANLTVDGMQLEGANLDKYSDGDSYVLSNNSGNVNIIGATNITANTGSKAFAFDVCKFQNYDAPVVTVNTTGKIDGKIDVTESIVNNITIYGGTFVADYTNYCADGIVCNESFKAVAKPVAKIGEIEYATLQAAIDAADAGQTVELLRNVTNGYGVKIDKGVTIDFDGKKYQLKKGVGSTGTETNGFQILKNNNVTIQNGTLEVNEVFKNYFYILVQNYANLTVTDMNLDGANLDKWSTTDGDSYVLSNNSGKVLVKGATNITANKDGDKAFAFDVCDKTAWGYEKPVVTIESTGMFDGEFEISKGLDENLHIKGGTYIKDVQEWCDGGYFASEDKKEAGQKQTWTVYGPYVAKVKETGVYYATLQAAIDAAIAGQTVEIVSNPRNKFVVIGAGAVINKDITIDLGGNAYVINKAVGSTGTETLGLQILAGHDVTLQNGTLTSTEVVEGKEVKMLVQNYANLTVKHINLVDDTEHILYVLSNNSGNVKIGEYTNIITDAVAFDVYKSAYYDAPVVTVDKNAGRIEGTIEVSPVIANNLTINGGIYSADYTDYCPDGLICVQGAEVFIVVEADVAMIGGTQYKTLEAAVEAATDGQTIELIRDVRNGYGVKIEKNLTIDFAGFKYQLKKGVGSTGTESNGLQILAGNTVALQNGALEVNPIFKYYFYILVQNYANLTVEDMNLDGANLDKWSETDGDSYVLSNNSGDVNIIGATNITKNDNGSKPIAFDVCKYASYPEPVVTITSTGMFDGDFEISEGLDENLHIQAGTYTKHVQEWCDPKYFSFENVGENTWTVKGPYVARIKDTYYATLPAAVEAAQDDDVVYLVCDAIGAGTVIDKDITIDFDNFTYTFNKTVGSAGTTTLGFQILKNNDVVLQNGTLKSTTEVEEGSNQVKMMVQNYANLTVKDMNLVDETEHILYVLSNNSGTVSIEGNTNITTDAVAFDVCKYASYPEPVVTLETKGTISGAIEVSATLYIEEATLAENIYSYILMQENGELFHKGIRATIKKEYKATSEVEWATDNWNTISTPVKGYSVVVDAEILNEPDETNAIHPGKHDLYWYDEATQYWRYVNGTVGDSDVVDEVESEGEGEGVQVVLNSGQGYLYTNNRNVRFSFTGELNTEAVVFPLSYTAGLRLAGFNLVGNPFTYNIGLENFKSEATLADGYYTITADGAWQARQEGAIITPMQSVLVKTDRAANLTINPKANKTRKASNASLEIVAYNDQYEDVAYVSFGEGLGLDKIEHRNSDIPMVFVPLNGKDYAIAAMSSDVKEIPVAFKANTMGQYTIEVNAKGCEFSEMYLVDRLTGEVTDLNSSDYTFIATAKDEANRFVIMFAEEAATSTTDNFAFINNGEIIIDNVEGNGVVRIYDMLGRPVSQYDVTESARISTSAFAGGLYIIQMVDGNGVKVQKVVID